MRGNAIADSGAASVEADVGARGRAEVEDASTIADTFAEGLREAFCARASGGRKVAKQKNTKQKNTKQTRVK